MLVTSAPAKINLYLHVTGRREDGYHLLDSLVAFASVGDRLQLDENRPFGLSLDGPMAGALAGEDMESNLVVRAARSLGGALARPLDFHLTLTKTLPIASGIGGGSADAAAALRLMAAHWGLSKAEEPLLHKIAAQLGQDIPCCLDSQTCYFRGIGDQMEAGPALPHTDIVLINPNKALATPSVFKARSGPFDPVLSSFPDTSDAQALACALKTRRNGLTEAAVALCPVIAEGLAALAAQEGCWLARMSGSGATCFGLFADRAAARQAAARLYERYPSWWVVPAFLPAPIHAR